MHILLFLLPIFQVALCLVLGCIADETPAVQKLSVAQLTGLAGVPLPYLHGVPRFTFPAHVPVNAEEVDSDEVTTAVHAVPYAYPTFHAAAAVPAFPAVAKTTLETQQVDTVDAAVPADTTKLAVTTQEHEVSVPTFNYYSYNGFPYNNFGYGFYNHYNPLTYRAAAGYPYQFGFPYNFGYNYIPNLYAAAAPAEDSSDEEQD